MKLLAICFLLAAISAMTMAQAQESSSTTSSSAGEVTTPNTSSATESPATVTNGETPVTPTEPTVPSSENTVASTESTGSGGVTSPTSSTTAVSSTVSSEATTIPANGETTASPNAKSLQCYQCANDDCSEKKEISCATNTAAAASALLLHNYRSISRADAADVKDYACYSIKVTVNDTSKQQLGCIAIPNGESACQAVRKELQVTTDDASDQCTACQTDLCNSGSAMAKLSVATLLCLILTKAFL